MPGVKELGACFVRQSQFNRVDNDRDGTCEEYAVTILLPSSKALHDQVPSFLYELPQLYKLEDWFGRLIGLADRTF